MMSPSDSERAGFWRRVSAFVLDILLIIVTVQIIGVWLAGVTDGKVRVSGTLVTATECTAGGTVPAELQLPGVFKVASVQRCTHSVFGIPYDWTLIASNQEKPARTMVKAVGGSPPGAGTPVAPGTAELYWTVPVDSTGRMTKPFYLDSLTLVLLVAYLFLCEWRFGATLGKRILGIGVRGLGGASMDATTAGRRILMRMVPLLPGIAFATMIGPPSSPEQPFVQYLIGSMIISAVGVVLIIVFFLNFIVTTSRRTLPWHDRFARTEAVRHAGARGAVSSVQVTTTS